MQIDIVLPSLNRIEKLTNTVNSIFMSAKDVPINLYLYFSVKSELDHFQNLFKDFPEVHCELVSNYRVPDFWNSHLTKMTADAIMYINDDVCLFPDTIQKVIKKFEEIGSLDCVIGLNQANLPEGDTLEGAFGVIGKDFASRFPNKGCWCLDYDRFYADKELWLYANEVKRFVFDKNIKIEHYHAAYYRDQIDTTHNKVRSYLPGDKKTYQQRQAKGYLWGRDFNLINKIVRI